MQNLLTHKKWILFITLLIVLGMATPVLADYLGPNRTVTTTVSVCKVYLYKCTEVEPGKWKDVKVEDWLCSNESKPWEAYDSGGACHSGNDGHKHWEKEDTIQTITITHPPATINGSLQNCTLSNGWCGVTAPELVLSANEPLAGYNITLIEGTLNGVSFACPSGAASCSLPLNQGDNTFNYWALSSWGDSSLMGTTTARVDTVPPEVSLNVTGTAGKNGWYKSGIQVAAIAQDVTSGVATFEVSVNGGGYQAYTDTTPIPFSDNALHTLQFRTMDNAGNLFETAVQNFYVDTIPPTVNLPASWQLGRNVPYDVIDEGSGLGALRIVIEDEDEKYAKVAWDQQVSGHTYSQDIDWNGEFKDGTIAPPGTYLVWLKASDVAGNEKFYLGKVIVPEPNYVGPSVLPTEAPVVAVEPLAPPAELTQPEDPTSLTSPESAATDASGTTTHSFTLTSGVAAGTAKGSSSPGILWGAAAAAAIGAATAYALDVSRKREEAEEAQAAQVKAEVARGKAERAEKKQKQQDNYNKQQTLAQAILAYQQKEQQKKEQQAAYNAHMDQKMAKRDQQDEVNWVAAQAAIKAKQEEKKKAEAAAAKQVAMLASLPSFNSEKQALVSIVAAPEKKPWWEKAIDTTVDFIGGAVYQWGRNNMDALAIVNPLPGKEKYFRDMANVDSQMPDTTAFKLGRLVGSIAGIVQGVWEMASGIATATGGTVISCGTVVLCIAGGGASLAAGAALVLHGAAVTGTSIYQTGRLFSEISKKDSEMKSYEDARKQGKMREAEHIDDDTISNPDFKEADGQYVDIKKPVPNWRNPLANQAQKISDNIRRTSTEVRFVVDLGGLSPTEKATFIQKLIDAGTDMSRVTFINQ